MLDTTGCAGNSSCAIWTNNDSYCTDACYRLTAQQCVGTSPVRTDCRLNFTSMLCYSTGTTDTCLSKATSSACTPGTCLWDPYVDNCFYNIAQTKQVFPCSYWTSFPIASACQYHGCALVNSGQCINAVSSGSTIDNSTIANYAQTIAYTSATVLANTQTLRLTIETPFAQSSRIRFDWPTSPAWPGFAIMPQLMFLPYEIGTTNKTNLCTSLSLSTNPSAPGGFVQFSYSNATLKSYVSNWVSQYHNLTFNLSDPLGAAANVIYGNPRIGPGKLITSVSVSFDQTKMLYTLQADMPSLVSQCGDYGASVTLGETSRTYNIPVSYIEWHTVGIYTQNTQWLSVTVQDSGGSSISNSAYYMLIAYPEVTHTVTDGCPAGSAFLRMTWRLIYNNVYDPTRQIGPRTASDIVFTTPALSTNVTSCYGEHVTDFQFQKCDGGRYSCMYTVMTESRCRVLTADGDAFNDCRHANASDAATDYKNASAVYPAEYNALHRFWVYAWNCPDVRLNDELCLPISNSPLGYPDEVKVTTRSSHYLTQSLSNNPFSVQAGFLPFPTASLDGFTNGSSSYDGNLYSQQPVTPVILLPPDIRSVYDLHLNNASDQFVVLALNALGQPYVPGEIPVWRLTYQDLRPGLLYTAKVDYQTSDCASTQSCVLLPACVGIPGCDGLSIPVSFLRQLMPANGYRFSVQYEIGLPTGKPASRRLLQLGQNETTSTGLLTFDLMFDVLDTQQCNFEAYREMVYAEAYEIGKDGRRRLRKAVLQVLVPVWIFSFIAFLLLSQYSKTRNVKLY